MKASRRRQRGFSLIEVVAATALTVIGMMAAYYLMGLGTSMNTDAKSTAQAYLAAQQEIEILRNMPYQPTAAFTGLVNIVRAPSNPEARFLRPDGADDASRYTDTGFSNCLVPALKNLPKATGGLIIQDDPVAGNLVKHVTVVIRWKDRGNESRSLTVGTLIAKGGIDPR